MKQVTNIPIYVCSVNDEYCFTLRDDERDFRVLIPADKVFSFVNLGYCVTIHRVFRVGTPLRVYRKYVTSLRLIVSENRLPNFNIMSSYE